MPSAIKRPADDRPRSWQLGPDRAVPLARPVVMGILNLTPDSFWDGGTLPTEHAAAERAVRMIAAGADMLDVGAESTRPGAVRVPAEEQIARLVPALRAIRAAAPAVPVTVDTTLAEVAHAALDAGADAINDVSAGEDSGDAMLRLAAAKHCGIVLMHRLRPPEQDRFSDRYDAPPVYADVVEAVGGYLAARASRAIDLGVAEACIALDPGLGFGKTVAQNLELIARHAELARGTSAGGRSRPFLSALSRKSFVGRVSLGRDSTPDERLPGTLSLSVTHLGVGAAIFRVHDVAEHRAALDAAFAVRDGR